jgi:hypothetical protein
LIGCGALLQRSQCSGNRRSNQLRDCLLTAEKRALPIVMVYGCNTLEAAVARTRLQATKI